MIFVSYVAQTTHESSNTNPFLLTTCYILVLQVISSLNGVRGFLDATEFGNWLKFVRCVDAEASHPLLGREPNMKPILVSGQVSTSVDIIHLLHNLEKPKI
jgi:hypothetical protein